MGDDDDTGGTTIRDLGVVSGANLITGFTNGTGPYAFATFTTSGVDITSAICTTNAWQGCASNVFSVTAGDVFRVSFDLTFNSGDYDVNVRLVGTDSGSSTTVGPDAFAADDNGRHTAYLNVTTTDSTAYLEFSQTAARPINFSATNISLTKDNLVTNGGFSDNSVPDTWNGSAPVNLVGWTSGGSAFTAAAHFVITDGKCRLISDGTNTVINSGTVVIGRTYQYSIDVTDVTTGGLTLIGGGHVLEANITSTGTYTGFYTATATGAISINRQSGTTDFTFDNVSVKQINGNPATLVNTPTFSTDTP
jgi:hypothetical protein